MGLTQEFSGAELGVCVGTAVSGRWESEQGKGLSPALADSQHNADSQDNARGSMDRG